MAVIIVAFACCYVLSSVCGFGSLLFSTGRSVFADGIILGVARSLYFSVVTFSTLGYGDIYPGGMLKICAAAEALIGLFVVALFTVSLARRLFRW